MLNIARDCTIKQTQYYYISMDNPAMMTCCTHLWMLMCITDECVQRQREEGDTIYRECVFYQNYYLAYSAGACGLTPELFNTQCPVDNYSTTSSPFTTTSTVQSGHAVVVYSVVLAVQVVVVLACSIGAYWMLVSARQLDKANNHPVGNLHTMSKRSIKRRSSSTIKLRSSSTTIKMSTSKLKVNRSESRF